MSSVSRKLRFVPAGHHAIAVVCLVLCAAAAAEAIGCPNCKDAVNTADPEGLNVARGYFYSILLMLAMPFTLVGSFAIYVWREMRRQKLSARHQQVEPLPQQLSHSHTAAVP